MLNNSVVLLNLYLVKYEIIFWMYIFIFHETFLQIGTSEFNACRDYFFRDHSLNTYADFPKN